MAEEKVTDTGYDFIILLSVLGLMAIGLVAVFSASSNLAEYRLGDGQFYFRRQAMFALVGLGVLFVVRRIPCTFYMQWVYPLLFLSLLLLVLLLVPPFRQKVGGAARWLRFGGFSFQPSELVKISLAIYMAYSMAKKGMAMNSFTRGMLPHLFMAGLFCSLIILQPDLGMVVIIFTWALFLLFVGGVRWIHILTIMIPFVAIGTWLVWRADYRLKRIMAFLDPWEDPQGIGFQIIHSFLAFGSGGITGTGMGTGKQKLFYLPEPHTDFILSVVGEELGFLGVAGIIFLFGVLIMRGILVALRARDLYSSYLALGLTCFLGLQVVINMAVVLGLLPTKGLTLPFISYGGSSLVMNLVSIGILLNISSRTGTGRSERGPT